MAITAEQAFAAANTYTEETVIGLGALKGAPCTIKETEHKDGQTKIVFEWTATDETKRDTTIYVSDGTPIYIYTAGNTYHYNDLAIYAGMLYRCTHEHVAPAELVQSYWDAIGSQDGNYSIVDTITDLPNRFTAADRKMYYVISAGVYYLWNGVEWKPQEPKSITTAEIDALFD